MDTTQHISGPKGLASTVAWGLSPVAWFLAFFAWVFTSGSSGHTAIGIVILALPAPWLLWASWRMPRPAVRTYLAEGGALAGMLVSLFVTAVYFLLGADPNATPSLGFTAVYLAAAAVLVAAAWPLAGRRIAYGAAALGCIVFALAVQVPQWRTESGSDAKVAYADEVLVYVLLGLSALGALLQIAWWVRGKLRNA